jgi:hypothetical protein
MQENTATQKHLSFIKLRKTKEGDITAILVLNAQVLSN